MEQGPKDPKASYLFHQSVFINRLYHEFGIQFDYEQVLETLYSRLIEDNWIVVDVGAHAGRHTEKFAALTQRGGRVFAFEPLPDWHKATRKKLAGFPHVEVRPLALADTQGEADFVVVPESIQESGLKAKPVYTVPQPSNFQRIKASVSTLDQELADVPRLDFVKIDVEGGEMGCLRGGAGLIARFRPIVTVEYHQNAYLAFDTTRESLFDFTEALNYVICDIFGTPVPSRELWQLVCDRTEYWDYVLAPAERLGLVLNKIHRNTRFRTKNSYVEGLHPAEG